MAHAFDLPVAPHGYQLVCPHNACAMPNLNVVEYLGAAEADDRFYYTDFPEPKDGRWSPFPDRPELSLELDPDIVRCQAIEQWGRRSR